MISDIYREEILEHYREPQNFGELPSFDVSSKQLNPFCGDEIEMFVKFNVREDYRGAATNTPRRCTILNIRFIGKGCAISIAAASILTEFVKGKSKTLL